MSIPGRIGNPFATGENRSIQPSPTAMVIFGASGDLTSRKLVPGLYDLYQEDYLPENFVVIGSARSDYTDEAFREHLSAAVREHSRTRFDEEVWKRFANGVFYQRLDGTKQEDFVRLRERLESIEKAQGVHLNYLYYLATAPSFFETISRNLAEANLIANPQGAARATRLVVEKPFGKDLLSAQKLNTALRECFDESQIFRIDHYLGKETVQNILVFRFANGLFEPLWNSNYIDHIQISVSESIGVGDRGAYFDQNGITRDIIQNHLFQLLSLLCIEAPISLSDADAIRDEKVKVLRAIREFDVRRIREDAIRGRYVDGYIDGKPVNGYRREQGISDSSHTETFAALKIEIENWRWSNVPIFIRSGKRLPKRITEILVSFKRPPSSLFRGRMVHELAPNVLAIQIQPEESISLTVLSKPPGPRMRVRPVKMDFQYQDSFGTGSPAAYERLLLDAMRGDATLFTRDDEIEQAWRILDPLLEAWEGDHDIPLHEYPAGTWGPPEAHDLIRKGGREWRQL